MANLRRQKGAALAGLLGMALVLLIALSAVYYIFGVVVPPGYIGVRQISFGPGQGFSDHGLQAGYQWSVPYYSRIHLVPRKVEVLEFNRAGEGGQGTLGGLEVQSADGSTIDVDISILRRIYSRTGDDAGLKHGGPAELFKNIGTTPASWDNHLRRIAEDELRRALGRLNTAQFYDPELREKAVAESYREIRRRVAEVGMAVDAVLLRRYTYRSERIDNAIFQKNLQEQEERYNAGSSKFSQARAEVEKVSAEGDAKVGVLRSDGESQAKVIRSEADLYETERVANGDLAVAQAVAEVDRLRASALAQSEAARIYVARELAPLLTSLKGGVVGGLDPYNIDEWLRKLGGEGPTK